VRGIHEPARLGELLTAQGAPVLQERDEPAGAVDLGDDVTGALDQLVGVVGVGGGEALQGAGGPAVRRTERAGWELIRTTVEVRVGGGSWQVTHELARRTSVPAMTGKLTEPGTAFDPMTGGALYRLSYGDVAAWAADCGLDGKLARDLATAVLIDPVDWPGLVTEALGIGSAAPVRTVLDLGPGNVLVRLTEGVVAGTGTTVVPAGTAKAIDDLDRAGAAPHPSVDRSRFAPRITRLPHGRLTLDTAFTRLTGRSAVLLAGMTPTTVDPAIVAAAAHAVARSGPAQAPRREEIDAILLESAEGGTEDDEGPDGSAR